MTPRWILTILLAASLGAALAADRRPLPWDKKNNLAGQALYRENCVVCHEIDRPQATKLGPTFYQLFKRDTMPIMKAKPNREYIKVRVKFGGPLMPAFRDRLSDPEIDTLIDYIASR